MGIDLGSITGKLHTMFKAAAWNNNKLEENEDHRTTMHILLILSISEAQ